MRVCRFLRKESARSLEAILKGDRKILKETENIVKFSVPFFPEISSIVASASSRAIVTGFDSESVTALKIGPGNFSASDLIVESTKSILLNIPSRMVDGPGNFFSTGLPEIDRVAPLTTGQAIAFTDPDGRREISRSIIDAQIRAGSEVFVISAADAGNSAASACLFFLARLRAAAGAAAQAALVLTDLDFFQEKFGQIEKELQFSFSAAIGAAQALAGGSLTVVTVGAAPEFAAHAIGQGATVLVSRDRAALLRDFQYGLVRPAESVMIREVREKLTQGLKLAEELKWKKDLKMHVDFWEDEELILFEVFFQNLRVAGHDELLMRVALLPSYNRKLTKAESLKWREKEPRLIELEEELKAVKSEEDAAQIYKMIDRILFKLVPFFSTN